MKDWMKIDIMGMIEVQEREAKIAANTVQEADDLAWQQSMYDDDDLPEKCRRRKCNDLATDHGYCEGHFGTL